jgi:hypothetical protein
MVISVVIEKRKQSTDIDVVPDMIIDTVRIMIVKFSIFSIKRL